ncbi:MAG: protoporphyrinogen oxidase [Chitinivibrionales bacterium]|nr:protoporphyrinogen oxidase [Chitinivibrionales bacterium]
MLDVAIIGAGIAGLTAAWKIKSSMPHAKLAVFERSPRPGGKIHSFRHRGFLIEAGPDSFLTRKSAGVELCAELGIAGKLIARRPEYKRTSIKLDGTLHELPEGLSGLVPTDFQALEKSDLLSEAGKNRLAQEISLPVRESAGDESIADFCTRRFGAQAWAKLFEPLLGGIYAGDGSRLSMQAILPNLIDLEHRYGSVIAGLKQKSTATTSTPPPFVSFDTGLHVLVDALVQEIGSEHFYTRNAIADLIRTDDHFTILAQSGKRFDTRTVLLAIPAPNVAKLTSQLSPQLARMHRNITYSLSAVVVLGYSDASTLPSFNGYGYVIPRIEQSDILACSWASQKWPGRAKNGATLLRVFIRGDGNTDVRNAADDLLYERAHKELAATVGITSKPDCRFAFRWPAGIPQFTPGYLQKLGEIKTLCATIPGLYFAGAAYAGPGIPDCIRSGRTAAGEIVKALESNFG